MVIILNKVDGSLDNYSNGEKISFYVLYPFLLFGVFVFNEIIILNFCGLNHNTKNEIMKRGNIDGIYQRNSSINKIEDDDYSFVIRNENDDD